MVNYLLSEEGQKVYNEGNVIYDSDLKIDRDLPLSITASKIRPLVHLLNTVNFSYYARCTIVDLSSYLVFSIYGLFLRDCDDQCTCQAQKLAEMIFFYFRRGLASCILRISFRPVPLC